MSQTITIKVPDKIALGEVQDILKFGKTHKPEWWNEAKERGYDIVKCPSILEMVNNSIVFYAPTDIKVEWDSSGNISIQSAAHLRGWSEEPVGTTINLNGAEEALPYYNFSGGSINFRVRLHAQFSGSDSKTIRTVWMPPTLFQKDSVNKRYSVTPGSVNFPPSWPLNPIAMLSVNISRQDLKSTTFIIKKGEAVGMYYFVDGISKVNYEVDRDMKPHTRSKIAAGADYLIESAKYEKCPFSRSRSMWSNLKFWWNK